jgi:hypothetical protein
MMRFACFVAFLAVCGFVEALHGHEDMRLACYVAFLAVVLVAEALRGQLEVSRARQRGIYPAKGNATMEDVRRLALSDKVTLAICAYRETRGGSVRKARRAVEQIVSSGDKTK